MSIGTVEATADAGGAAIPPGAVAESQRAYHDAEGGEGGSAADILARLDAFGSDDGETLESAVDADVAATIRKEPAAEAKGDETEDEDAKIIRELNAKSLARRKAKNAATRPAQVAAAAPAQTPAVDAAAVAAKAADAAAATKTGKESAPSNEVAMAVRDVLAQIERLAGEDEAAAAKTAAGTADKGAEARAADLKGIREKVEKIAEGLSETGALKTSIEKLQQQLKDQADDNLIRQHVASEIDRVAADVPTVASGSRHEVKIQHNGVAKTVRMTGAEIVRYQAERFFEKYKVAPDLKELAKRIEKRLTGTTQEKNGEKTAQTRKTVSTSHSSPPAARQGPDKRSGKEAEHDFFKRLGLADEIRD